MSNTKKEKIFIKNILEELGKSNLRIINVAGDRANYEELSENLSYGTFRETFDSYLQQFYELVENKTISVPDSLSSNIIGFGAKSVFAEEVLASFDTSENSMVPSWYKNLFNEIGKAILISKLIPEEPLSYESSVTDMTFNQWLTSNNIVPENDNKRAALHYIYSIFSGDSKKLQHFINIQYNYRAMIPVVTYTEQKCLYYGTVILYPSTGETIRYTYGNGSAIVPEYGDEDLDFSLGTALDILFGKWFDRDKEKAPQDTYNARSIVYRYKNRNYGVAGWFTSGTIPKATDPPSTFNVPDFNSPRDKTNVFLVSSSEEYYLSNPLNDLTYRSASLPGTYDSTPPKTNLDFFSPDFDWTISTDVKPYDFKKHNFSPYNLAFIDATRPGIMVLEPGEQFDESGVLTGYHTIGGQNQDTWLEAFDRSNNADELAQNIVTSDLPAYVVDKEKNEVIGNPDLTIDEAENNLENQFPSYTTNPSVIGLNVYSGRRLDIGNVIDELWSTNFSETVANILASPLDAVVSVHTIPIAPTVSGNSKVKIGNYPSSVTMGNVVDQVASRPIGFFEIRPIYADTEFSFADYKYTTVSLYVPYCGSVDIPAYICMGKTVSVSFFVDVLSGKCTSTIKVGEDTYAVLSGECALKYPMHGANYSTDFSSRFPVGSFKGAMDTLYTMGLDLAGLTKTDIRGGVGGSITGFVNNRCVLVISRPIIYGTRDNSINKTYSCLLRGKLSEFSGFVRVSKFYQRSGDFGIATKEELAEIESLLQGGIYL